MNKHKDRGESQEVFLWTYVQKDSMNNNLSERGRKPKSEAKPALWLSGICSLRASVHFNVKLAFWSRYTHFYRHRQDYWECLTCNNWMFFQSRTRYNILFLNNSASLLTSHCFNMKEDSSLLLLLLLLLLVFNPITFSLYKSKESFCRGSGCGTVARVVASDPRDPRFTSSYRQLYSSVNCMGKGRLGQDSNLLM